MRHVWARCLVLLCDAGLVAGCAGDPPITVIQAPGVNDKPCRWSKLELEFQLADSRRASVSVDELRRSLEHAADAWGVRDRVAIAGVVDDVRGIMEDGRNTVLVNDRPRPAPAMWSPKTHAATRPYTRDAGEYAEILEADIVVASKAVGRDPSVSRQRLTAVLVHELGHVLGLDHSCTTLRVGTDAKLPLCSQASERVRRAVMYADPLEVGRELSLMPLDEELEFVQRLYSAHAVPSAYQRWYWASAAIAVVAAVGLLRKWRQA